jgi:circadian clock protein KaiB
MTKPVDSTRSFRAATERASEQQYVLKLYIAGSTPGSTAAVEALSAICEQHLQGRYQLQIIDVYQQPDLARAQQIVAVPTLVKQLPEPMRRILGDLSDKQRVLVGLDLKPRSHEQERPRKKR